MKKTAYLTRIKDEQDLIYYNLEYHYNLGIRNFYITFNNSNDETKRKVGRFWENYPEANLFFLSDKSTTYNHTEMFNEMSDFAYQNGHVWQVPIDSDELLVLKNESLEDFIKKYDSHEYGFINFRWIDYQATKTDDPNEKNFFLRWRHREPNPRKQSKIIYKWSPGCKHGDGHHLLISKRRQIAEIASEEGFYAHFPNRGKDQIMCKRIRIGEAFQEKYGYDSDKHQVKEYRLWEEQGPAYFDKVWDDICKKRESNFTRYIQDPINPDFFK